MKLAILGSTGSIGRQALACLDDAIDVVALACARDDQRLYEQYLKHRPNWLHVDNADSYKKLKCSIDDAALTLSSGHAGLIELARHADYDVILTSVVGAVGLLPTIEAIKRGKKIALANKETLVVFGEKIMAMAEQYGASIIPVDSEHSAIFQSLQGNAIQSVEKLLLTASGGPFRTHSKQELRRVTVAEALRHPNWSMGDKITIDSATLMNKGLEVIEARWLFNIQPSAIDVVVHPESIIHSLVQYVDGSVIAQLGLPDMQLPIHYALHYPTRKPSRCRRLDLADIAKLTFYQPDTERFPCLALAYRALEAGGTAPCVLNAANEVMVARFLKGDVSFYAIPHAIDQALQTFGSRSTYALDDIIDIDRRVRDYTLQLDF